MPSINIDGFEGHDFEQFCAEILQKIGYANVRVTKGSGDFGADVIAEKDSVTYAIQCKSYEGHPVGNKAVQEAISGKSYYHCAIAAVMTNSYFTSQAIEMAQKTSVVLWDRNSLMTMAQYAYPEDDLIRNQLVDKEFEPKQDSEPEPNPEIVNIQPPQPAPQNVQNNKKRRTALKIVCVIVAIFVVFAFLLNTCSSSKTNDPEQSPVVETVWAQEYAPLDDFEYYVDYDNTLHLTQYTGNDTKISISPVYEVDGIEMSVTALENAFRNKNKMTSLIIPSTVTAISDNELNGVKLQYIFLPASIESFNGWSNFNNVQRLFYGGTISEWEAICTAEREDINIVRIVCEADPSSLPN